MEEENKIYRKVGRKYEPIGYHFHRDYLTDGIWYVRSKGSHVTNGSYLQGLFKISGKPLFDNFQEYCDLEDVAEAVMNDKDFKDFMHDKNGWSINDIVHLTVAILKRKAQEQNGQR